MACCCRATERVKYCRFLAGCRRISRFGGIMAGVVLSSHGSVGGLVGRMLSTLGCGGVSRVGTLGDWWKYTLGRLGVDVLVDGLGGKSVFMDV